MMPDAADPRHEPNYKEAMSPEDFKTEMIRIVWDEYTDLGSQHAKADELMCKLLTSLGYEDGIEVYEQLERYFE